MISGELVPEPDFSIPLEHCLVEYQGNRGQLAQTLLENISFSDTDKNIPEILLGITEQESILTKRLETLQKVEDISDLSDSPKLETLTNQKTLLRSLSLHAQMLTRAAFFAEKSENPTVGQIQEITAHLRGVNEVFYLFQVPQNEILSFLI